MDTDLDTLATALYVTADDLLKAHPERVPVRPAVGFVERISDAELIVLAVMQAFLGYTSEARWLRYAHRHLAPMFPYLPRQSGYNKRLRKLNGTMAWLASALAQHVPAATDDVWVVDSTPVECGRSRETAKRSDLAGWAEYGYCASHSRCFWGLRLHLVCTPHGLPLAWVLTGAKTPERAVLEHLLATTPTLQQRPQRRRQIIVADKGYYGRDSKPDWQMPTSTCSDPPARARSPARATVLQTVTTGHRVGQRHSEGSTRSRRPRRTHHGRCRCPGRTADPGPDRSHLAQPPSKRPSQKITDRLRPLTPRELII